MIRQLTLLLAVCIFTVALGCSSDPANAPRTTRVVLLGHDARASVLQTIADNHRGSAPTSDNQNRVDCQIGSETLQFTMIPINGDKNDGELIESADVAVIVIDVSEYDPTLFETFTKRLSSNSSAQLILLFANTHDLLLDKTDSVELLELSELDARENLNKYGLDGDNAPWFFDSSTVIADDRPPMGTSVSSVVEYIAKRAK